MARAGDWEQMTAPISHLRIPGEGFFRFWESHVMGYPKHGFPDAAGGLHSFMLEAYACLATHEKFAETQLEMFRFWSALRIGILTGREEHGVKEQDIDEMLTLLWRWQRKLVPTLTRPQSKAADNLEESMRELDSLFNSQTGIAIQAADGGGRKRR